MKTNLFKVLVTLAAAGLWIGIMAIDVKNLSYDNNQKAYLGFMFGAICIIAAIAVYFKYKQTEY